MKKIEIISSLTIFLMAISVSVTGEEEGLIQKIQKKFTKKEKVSKPSLKEHIDESVGRKEETPIIPEVESTEESKKVETGDESKETAVATTKPWADLTVPELTEYIEGVLDYEEEILNFIPELKKEEDATGNVFYTYEGVRLSELDMEKLDKVFVRVRNEDVRIRTERMNEQLQSIQRSQQAIMAAQQASRASVIVTPPPQPPQAPPTPSSASQIPKPPPPPPPQPPRR